MAQSKNGIEVLECYFNVDLSNITGFSIDAGLGDITGYALRVTLGKPERKLTIYCMWVDLAEVQLPSLEDFTFEIIADLTTTALLNLSLTHRCKKCAAPMNFHHRRMHVNGICRNCLLDYTRNKKKWGLTSVEQYKNEECPILCEKLELGSTYITKCCNTGIEWDTFNDYCRQKANENDNGILNIKCPFCRADNKRFLHSWSHWCYKYDYDDDSEHDDDNDDDDNDDDDDAPRTPQELLAALRQIDAIEEREAREASMTAQGTALIQEILECQNPQ